MYSICPMAFPTSYKVINFIENMFWIRHTMDFYDFVASPFLLPVVKVKARDKKQSILHFPLKIK